MRNAAALLFPRRSFIIIVGPVYARAIIALDYFSARVTPGILSVLSPVSRARLALALSGLDSNSRLCKLAYRSSSLLAIDRASPRPNSAQPALQTARKIIG